MEIRKSRTAKIETKSEKNTNPEPVVKKKKKYRGEERKKTFYNGLRFIFLFLNIF